MVFRFLPTLLAISLPRNSKNATQSHEIGNRNSRADSPCQGCDRSSTGTRIHSERTATYVAVLERVAPYCSRIDRGATSNAPRRRRGEERDEEGTRARVSRRRKGCAEGGGATMEGSGDACACFAASLSNYRAFCPLRSQVVEEKIYLPACLSVSLALLVCLFYLVDLPCNYLLDFPYVSLRFSRYLAYISLFIINLSNLTAMAAYVVDR